MPNWFRRKGASESQVYENIDLRFETYTGGIAPVTISVDENDEAAAQLQQKRSWKQRKPLSMFADKEDTSSQSERERTTGNDDSKGTPSGMDICCNQDGNLDCMSFDTVNLCGGGATQEKTIQTTNINGAEQLEMCPVKSMDSNATTGTATSQELNKIRSMGAIRDKNKKSNSFSGSVYYYLSQCSWESPPSEEKGGVANFIKQRYKFVAAGILLFLVAMLSGVLAYTLRRQKNRYPNGKNSMIGTEPKKEERVKALLDKTPESVWETEGSPQNQALEWVVYEDPTALSLEDDEQIKERFAAATLYFGTNGNEWKTDLGFLSESSICEWNMDGGKEPMGVFCKDGRVIEINIVNHTMSGSLTSDMNYFTELVVLNLYFNDLSGPIPDLSSLVKLEQLDLDDNQLSGKVPESIFQLPRLENLSLLFNSGLTGSIPEIEDSSRLVAISLLGCSFSGTLPNSLVQLPSLRHLQLKGNNIGGTIPDNLLSSATLETIGLDDNQFSGSIPPVMVTQYGSKLENLGLGSNNLVGGLPYGMDDLTSLKSLYADNNKLTGSIRNTIIGLPNLEKLYLQGNRLSGDLSHFLVESKVLTDVYLGDNDFSGDLSDFLMVAPPSLERLDLSNNRGMDGYLSADIGNFASLKFFNISGCRLGYEIPAEIGRLKSLEILDLSWNDFQGDVPDEMANMGSLNWFDISRNRDLGGDLSNSLCEENFDLVHALADCAGKTRVECDCCTHCCTREGVCGPNKN